MLGLGSPRDIRDRHLTLSAAGHTCGVKIWRKNQAKEYTTRIITEKTGLEALVGMGEEMGKHRKSEENPREFPEESVVRQDNEMTT